MKNFIAICILMLSTALMAESGFYGDPERNGEGLILSIEDSGRIGIAFFTYADSVHVYPPVLGPNPPIDPLTPPPTNAATWYIGSGQFGEHLGEGDMFRSIPLQYPLALDGMLSVEAKVGRFHMARLGDGFEFRLECNSLMLPDQHICNSTFYFTEKFLGE